MQEQVNLTTIFCKLVRLAPRHWVCESIYSPELKTEAKSKLACSDAIDKFENQYQCRVQIFNGWQ